MVQSHRIIRWLLLFAFLSSIYFLSLLYSPRKEEFVRANTFVNYNHSFNSTPLHFKPKLKMYEMQIHAAVVLSLSKHSTHIAEFHLLYESWRFIQNFSPLSQQVIIDLIIFCEKPSCYQLPSSCIHLSYNKKNPNSIAKCYYQELSRKIVQEWKTYLYMTSIAFMLTNEYKNIIYNYQWVLRVDQDAILSPGLLMGLMNKHPQVLYDMQFGGLDHGNNFTNIRIKQIAKKLGYKHSGIHDLCSTWLVNPEDSIELANLTTQIGKHFLKNEFGPNVPGIEDLPLIGEWPKWWRGVTSLYAGEIAINHLYSSSLSKKHSSNALDHPSYSDAPLWDAWHIHCLHDSYEFAKFHHRDNLNIFLHKSQEERIKIMSNITLTQNVFKNIMNEYRFIQKNNGQIFGNITVRDYVTALAWQKAYSAIGAINLN